MSGCRGPAASTFTKSSYAREGMPVIFMTAFADVPMAIRALKSGRSSSSRNRLTGKPSSTASSARSRPTSSDFALKADRETSLRRFRLLTVKEREVLALIKEGQPNKAISVALGITSRAVEMRRAGLMKKLGARSFAELLRLSIELETAEDGRIAEPR